MDNTKEVDQQAMNIIARYGKEHAQKVAIENVHWCKQSGNMQDAKFWLEVSKKLDTVRR